MPGCEWAALDAFSLPGASTGAITLSGVISRLSRCHRHTGRARGRGSPARVARLISVAWRLRLDGVGCLPQRLGYPVPEPELAELRHQFGEQFP